MSTIHFCRGRQRGRRLARYGLVVMTIAIVAALVLTATHLFPTSSTPIVSPTATLQSTSTPIATPLSPTLTPEPVPSATLTPVVTLTPEPVPSPTLTLVAAPTPRPTLAPTLKPSPKPVVRVPYSFTLPALGISGPIGDLKCGNVLPNLNIWYWGSGCVGDNNLLLLSHNSGAFKPIHDGYHSGALKIGLAATYEDKAGTVHQYVISKIYDVTRADSNSGWVWAATSGPVITLVTCDGTNNQLRIIVRLTPVGTTVVDS